MADPQTDVEARLHQLHDEIGMILDGETARETEGKTVGGLEDIDSVVFGLGGNDLADVRLTQEPVEEPPVPIFTVLGELLDGLAAATGRPSRRVADEAVRIMEASRASSETNALKEIEQRD